MTTITSNEIKHFSRYIYKISGITVDKNKAYLLKSRLNRLLKEYGCGTYSEFHRRMLSDGDKTLEREVINAVTTRETYFFRDTTLYETLRNKILPDLIDRRSAAVQGGFRIPIRIWSAACSTGQETYSIAMVLKESLGDLHEYDVKLLGTDISDAAIAHASCGRYSKLAIERGLSTDKIARHFNEDRNSWRIKDELRAMTAFKRLNLMEPIEGLH